jgi:Tfp pilus assembly protein PilF
MTNDVHPCRYPGERGSPWKCAGSKKLTLIGALLGSLVGCSQTPEQKYARFLERRKKFVEAKDFSRATVELFNAIREQPAEAEAYYWVAQAFLGRNQLVEAIASLRKAVDIRPDYSAAQLKLAELMIRSRDEELFAKFDSLLRPVFYSLPWVQPLCSRRSSRTGCASSSASAWACSSPSPRSIRSCA